MASQSKAVAHLTVWSPGAARATCAPHTSARERRSGVRRAMAAGEERKENKRERERKEKRRGSGKLRLLRNLFAKSAEKLGRQRQAAALRRRHGGHSADVVRARVRAVARLREEGGGERGAGKQGERGRIIRPWQTRGRRRRSRSLLSSRLFPAVIEYFVPVAAPCPRKRGVSGAPCSVRAYASIGEGRAKKKEGEKVKV